MSATDTVEKIHVSVLLEECVHYLNPVSDGVYVDGTLGLGGHTEAILSATAPGGKVIAFEWDEKARNLATQRLQAFGDRVQIIPRNFAEIKEGLENLGIEQIDGLLIDIGLSSLQLDAGKRGFSFQVNEPLDMRMDVSREVTAQKIVNTCSAEELADIFYYYGEERQARPIAAAIVAQRVLKAIETTGDLVEVVAGAVPKKYHPKKIHVATKVFQALRIAVNGELENLAKIIDDGVGFLRPGARFCVISFHSLEDRIVKRRFAANEQLEVITRKPVMPTLQETMRNPRARSARLRVAQKIH